MGDYGRDESWTKSGPPGEDAVNYDRLACPISPGKEFAAVISRLIRRATVYIRSLMMALLIVFSIAREHLLLINYQPKGTNRLLSTVVSSERCVRTRVY